MILSNLQPNSNPYPSVEPAADLAPNANPKSEPPYFCLETTKKLIPLKPIMYVDQLNSPGPKVQVPQGLQKLHRSVHILSSQLVFCSGNVDHHLIKKQWRKIFELQEKPLDRSRALFKIIDFFGGGNPATC